MNLRKFYFILTIIVSSVLFCAGAGVLYYVNSNMIAADASAMNDDNSINKIFQPFMMSKQPFNVLLLGGDKVNNNADTIMIANFDPATCKVNIMSVPRDTKVTIEGKERKINYSFPHGGVELTVKTASELLGINIKYYAFVDTAAFREIIDILGGVDYYVPVDMNYDDPLQNLHIHLKKGQQTLTGEKAEQYVRFRKPNKWNSEIKKYYDGSDIKRTEAQQKFMKELMKQKLTLQYLPKLNSVVETVFDNVETNMALNEVIKLTGYINKFDINNVTFIPMPGTTYDASPWYYLCDVESTRQIMAESFICNDSFVKIDEKAKNAYNNKNTKPASSSKAKDTEKAKGTGTKNNNPSNAESSLPSAGTDDP